MSNNIFYMIVVIYRLFDRIATSSLVVVYRCCDQTIILWSKISNCRKNRIWTVKK